MSDVTLSQGMGLTTRQAEALRAIVEHVAMHGVMPSRSSLAGALGCNRNNANRLMEALVERGVVFARGKGAPLAGFGNFGTAVCLDFSLASTLAQYCGASGEDILSVVHDAIALHLDQLALPANVAAIAAAPAEEGGR